MSNLASVTLHLLTLPLLIPLDGGSLLDWAASANAKTLNLVRGISITLGVIFVIWQAVASRMAMARVIISGLAAGIFIWFVFNVTDVRDRVGRDLESSAAQPRVIAIAHAPAAARPATVTTTF